MLNIIVGEFTELRVVNTDNLSILRCAERKAGDEVHDEQDEAGAEEAVGETRDTVCELISELDVMAIQPAAIDLGETVEMRNVVTVSVRLADNQTCLSRGTHAANKPVNKLPTIPPTACSAKISSESSIRM